MTIIHPIRGFLRDVRNGLLEGPKVYFLLLRPLYWRYVIARGRDEGWRAALLGVLEPDQFLQRRECAR